MLVPLALRLANRRFELVNIVLYRVELFAFLLVRFERLGGLVASVFCLIPLRFVVLDSLVELGEVAFTLVEPVVEVSGLLRGDLLVELIEPSTPVFEHVFDAEPGVAGPLAVLLQLPQLEEVVDRVLSLARARVDQLVHLALPDVRAVDERLGVHPQELGDELSDRRAPSRLTSLSSVPSRVHWWSIRSS